MALLPAVQPVVREGGPSHPTSPDVRSATDRRPLLTTSLGLLGLVLVLVLALVVGGGRPVPAADGLPDAGAVTGWAQPVVDLAVRLLAVLTIGQLTYAALLAPGGPHGLDEGARRALRWSTWSAAGWLLAEAAALVLTASTLYGVPVTRLSVQGVLALLTQLPVGRASLVVGLLLVVVLVGTVVATRTAHVRAVLLVALAAVVVPVVLAGHSAAAEDHVPAVVSLSVHVVTASLWVGGLVGLLLHGRGSSSLSGPSVVVAVRRFSALALGCIALLLASGVAAALLVAGAPSSAWLGEGWVRLLAVKTALLLTLAGMGWWHRRRTLPLLAAGGSRAFLRLAVVEVAVMTVTLAVSVALAASPAPVAAEPGAAAAVVAADAPVADAPVADAPVDGAPVADAPAADAPVADAPVDGAPVDAAPGDDAGATADPMAGHDHGELSVSVLVDEERFHVAGTVRPGQRVTVYNGSDAAATITALDGTFDVAVPARTFITFEAPATSGEHPFVSRAGGADVAGFADVLQVRETG